ncbi:MAG: Fic family protein [Bdellovibrionaceae bacterium]|nr:Fic family protein [Pseudobdellovibrionaceae bacterium]
MDVKYIHSLKGWPNFTWNKDRLALKLEKVRLKQGRLIGTMERLGFKTQEEAVLQTLTEDILKTSEIEGELLDKNQVRSSIARKLGMDIVGLVNSERSVDGIVEMMLDATQKYRTPLTAKRLFSWHAALFPTGRNGMTKIIVAKWRNDSNGPMQVISGPIGKSKVHFQAPDAKKLKKEMAQFLSWANNGKNEDSLLRAAIAHLWFITIHPFEDGNGRIARAITDMFLAKSEDSPQRFYSMSAQICLERKDYYIILESIQKGKLDITAWLDWFLNCLDRALINSETILSSVLKKATFWESHMNVNLNERQRKLINRLLDGFEGNLTSSKWAAIAKCSQDTASRDIDELIKIKILKKNPGGGRNTSYSLF